VSELGGQNDRSAPSLEKKNALFKIFRDDSFAELTSSNQSNVSHGAARVIM
jgi:hypothetical protein